MRFALAKHGFAITTGASRSKLGDQIQFSFKQRLENSWSTIIYIFNLFES